MPTAPTTPPDITDLSTPPNRLGTSDTVFVAAVDTFFGELPTFGTEQNTLADWEFSTAGQVYANANEAFASAQAAASSAADSLTYSQNSAASANFAGLWSSATGAASPASYQHDNALWLLLVNVADITLTEPSTTNSDWQLLDGGFTGFVITDTETLAWQTTNEIQANATVTMPLANLVSNATYLDIYVAEKFKGITVTINASGSDLFDNGTTDAQLVLKFTTGGYYRISSDGINRLRV